MSLIYFQRQDMPYLPIPITLNYFIFDIKNYMCTFSQVHIVQKISELLIKERLRI